MMVETLTLPTEKSQPITDIRGLTTLMYGLPKIGKTTWAAGAEDALFFATEEGQNHVAVNKVSIPNWESFCTYCQLVGDGNHQFKTIVIDTIDNLFDLCVAHFNAIHKIEYEGDLGYGKGFSLIRRTMIDALRWLSHLPYGLIMLSHATQMEVKGPTGVSTKYTCTLPEKMKDLIYKMSDLFLFAELEEQYDHETGAITGYERVVRTQPTTIYEAGDRTGRLPETLPLNYDAFAYYINQPAVEAVGDAVAADDPPIDDSYNPYESE